MTTNINELIKKHCPNGAPHKRLGEIAYYPKARVAAATLTAENYVGVENLLQNKQGKKPSECVPQDGNFIEFKENDILVGNIRPYLKKIWRATVSGGTNGDVLVVRIRDEFADAVSPEFLYYVLSSDRFFAYAMQFAKGAKMPRGDKEKTLEYLIPTPPLPVQREIVRILDKFTELEAELEVRLEAELAARQKQYRYYRESLFLSLGVKIGGGGRIGGLPICFANIVPTA